MLQVALVRERISVGVYQPRGQNTRNRADLPLGPKANENLTTLINVSCCVGQQNKWEFMNSCCNACGVGLTPPHVSPTYALLISIMMSSYSSFSDDVLYTTAVQIRA